MTRRTSSHLGIVSVELLEDVLKLTEAHGQYQCCSRAGQENKSNNVNVGQSRTSRDRWSWIFRWHQEEVHRRKQGTNTEIDVETPSPCGRRLSKCAACSSVIRISGFFIQRDSRFNLPIIGPKTVPIPHVIPGNPIYNALSFSVVVSESSVRAPTYIPLPPTPHIARPAIRLSMFGAAPHRALPASKMTMQIMKTHFTLSWP